MCSQPGVVTKSVGALQEFGLCEKNEKINVGFLICYLRCAWFEEFHVEELLACQFKHGYILIAVLYLSYCISLMERGI